MTMNHGNMLGTLALAIAVALATIPRAPAGDTAPAVTWSQHDVTSAGDILGGPAGLLPGSAKAVAPLRR